MKKYFIIMLLSLITSTFAAEPYFVSTLCKSTKIVVAQNIQFSFTTTPAKYDTLKDSTFSCDGDNCTWSYTIKEIDTLTRGNTVFSYTIVDSSRYVDTLNFSFFDAENDSCKFIIAGLDSEGNKVYADSLWGDTTSRPGSNKVIYFSHRKLFYSILPGIIQLSNLSDTISDTIQYSSTSIFNLITDSSFFANLNGAWKKIYQQDKYSGSSSSSTCGSFVDSSGGYFFDSNTAREYNKDKSVINSTSLDSYIRDGWILKKENNPMYDPLTNVIVGRDTLITCAYSQGGISRHNYTYFYVRDTSLKFSDLPVKRHFVQKTDIFKVNISSNRMAPVISFMTI